MSTASAGSNRDTVLRICRLIEEHQAYRASCLNMIASEGLTSPLTEAAMSSDLSRRYVSDHYAGRKVFRQIYDVVITLARQVFRARYVDIRPIVGHITVLASIMAFLRPGDTVMTIDPAHGGYPITMTDWAGIRKVFHPFDPETHNVKIAEAQELIRRTGPKLVILGGSRILFPYPVAEIAQTAHEIGATVYFDGSHVMGLIAGNQFQQPLAEGADVLGGSTHKTLCGPQRGIIVTNSEDLSKRIDAVLGDSIMLQSNYHPASLAALGIALAEMKQFGTAYAAQVVANAQVLARALYREGVPPVAAGFGYTRSHQVILDVDRMSGLTAGDIMRRLEDAGIIGGTRLGTQEVTRLGMKESEMEQIARLVADALFQKRPTSAIRGNVSDMAHAFSRIHYSFQDDKEAYDFIGQAVLDDMHNADPD